MTSNRIPAVDWVRDALRVVSDKCFRIERLLSLYADDQLSQSQKLRVEAHLTKCPSCRTALAIMQTTNKVLSERTPAQPPAYLSERLRQAIAIEATRPTSVKVPSRSSLNGRIAFAGAGAATVAALLIVLSINHGQINDRPTIVEPGKPIATVAANRPSEPSNLVKPPAVERHITVPQPTEVASNSAPDSESYTKPVPSLQISVRTLERSPGITRNQPETVNEQAEPVRSQAAVTQQQAVPAPPPQQIAESIPNTMSPPPAASPEVNNGATITQQEQTPTTVDTSSDVESPHLSLVDEMRSMAIRTENEQPKLIRLAVQRTPLAITSQGLIPITGSAIQN